MDACQAPGEETMSYIRIHAGYVVKLTGSYGRNTSNVCGPTGNATIDATGASWIVANSANPNPDAGTSSLERD